MTLDVPLVGTIERRLLVNYRADPEVVQRLLPAPFRPQLVHGHAVAGICLIRLGSLRPPGLPAALGLRSENAAHRIAVEWDDGGETRTGVYIPRRDTASRLTTVVGGRIFPGHHHRARFVVEEHDDRVAVSFRSDDGDAAVSVHGEVVDELRGSELFADLAEASTFFEAGAVGWSAATPTKCDGLRLETTAWRVEPLLVRAATSSYFADTARFPDGSVELDSALVMRDVPVRWRPLPQLPVSAPRQCQTPVTA